MAEITLQLSEHELRSVRSWLSQMPEFQTGGAQADGRWDIWITRPSADFQRPALRISEAVPRVVVDWGRSWQRSEMSWQIEVLTGDDGGVNPKPDQNYWACQRYVAAVTNRLLRSRLIPLYLWRWQYLRPQVKEVPGEGSLPDGLVSVRVSAVNGQGEESLASDPVDIEVSTGAAVEILIPPWPRTARVAEEYRVFAGAAGAETWQVDVAPADGPIPTMVSLASITPGDPPPTDSRFHSQRFIRLESVEDQVMEHPDVEGLFNGVISVRTAVHLVRDPVNEWAEPFGSLETRVEAS